MGTPRQSQKAGPDFTRPRADAALLEPLLPPDRETLTRQIEALGDWFHNLELRGVHTAPNHFLGDFPAVKWKHIAAVFPDDLTGMSVLDIGCNAGFYSIELKKR